MKDLFRKDIKIDFTCLKAKNLPENPLRVHEPLASEQKEIYINKLKNYQTSQIKDFTRNAITDCIYPWEKTQTKQ